VVDAVLSTHRRTFSAQNAVYRDSLTGIQIKTPYAPPEEFNGNVASGVNRFKKKWASLGKLSQM
jgi:hypothetical protein